MRQVISYQTIHPCARHGAQKRNRYNRQPAAYKGEKRPGAGAGNGPAQAEYQPAVNVAPGKFLFGDHDRFAIYRPEIKAFYQPYGNHPHHNGAADNAVHMERLEPEHFLYPEPGDDLAFNKHDPK